MDHAGLELSQLFSDIPKGDFEAMMEVMRNATREMRILLDTDDHRAMLTAPQIVEIHDHTQRQQFFRELFALCVDNADDGECVFPTLQTVLNRKNGLH